ncbi:MAG: hypothetical protein GEU75_06930 [Dehalococcoidia bacterium]|nr:hypothetical protein [Dehalococcoidia bacterium]
MVGKRICRGITSKGERCLAAPLRDSDFCTFHDPEHNEAVASGRKLGGQRRRSEGALAAAYDFDGLNSVMELRRLLEIATLDTLNLGNSIARNRALMSAVLAGAKLLEAGELEERLADVEAALGQRSVRKGR